MNDLTTLRAQLALELEFARQRLRKAWTAFPPRPDFEWEGSRTQSERERAMVRNRNLLEGWKEQIRAWKADNAIAVLPEALESAIDAL